MQCDSRNGKGTMQRRGQGRSEREVAWVRGSARVGGSPMSEMVMRIYIMLDIIALLCRIGLRILAVDSRLRRTERLVN